MTAKTKKIIPELSTKQLSIISGLLEHLFYQYLRGDINQTGTVMATGHLGCLSQSSCHVTNIKNGRNNFSVCHY